MVSLLVFGGCIWGSVGILVSVYIWCPSWETTRHGSCSSLQSRGSLVYVAAAGTVVGLVIHSHEAR